jgi:hypothetical protein
VVHRLQGGLINFRKHSESLQLKNKKALENWAKTSKRCAILNSQVQGKVIEVVLCIKFVFAYFW